VLKFQQTDWVYFSETSGKKKKKKEKDAPVEWTCEEEDGGKRGRKGGEKQGKSLRGKYPRGTKSPLGCLALRGRTGFGWEQDPKEKTGKRTEVELIKHRSTRRGGLYSAATLLKVKKYRRDHRRFHKISERKRVKKREEGKGVQSRGVIVILPCKREHIKR